MSIFEFGFGFYLTLARAMVKFLGSIPSNCTNNDESTIFTAEINTTITFNPHIAYLL